MRVIGLLLILSISFLLLLSSVYAEVLHTDIIKKFFLMTGMATEDAPTEGGGATETPQGSEAPAAETQQPETGGEGGGEAPTTETTQEVTTTEEVVEAPVEEIPTEEAEVTTVVTPSEEPVITPPPEISGGGEEVPPEKIPVIQCPPPPETGRQCSEGESLTPLYDDKGCLVGNECRPMIKPVEGEVRIDCPQNRPCPDGSNVPCHIENNNCICDPCPIREEKIPEGCRQEIDKETGFVKLVCEKRCPADEQQRKLKDDCYAQGGNPVPFNDPSGCIFYDCKFGERQKEEAAPNPIYGYEECPPQEEVDSSIEKCKDMGMVGTISFEGGCKVAKCVEKTEEKCKIITAEMRMTIEGECEKQGLRAIKDFDEKGCPFFACAGEGFCKMDLPKEAFDECRMKGGEMVVKNDDRGCIIYSNCVVRGDKRNVYVEPVGNVPEPTELLAVAFKLEQLKIELDKLARQANDIADYYASVGDPEEHRFRRASDMFFDVKDKIDGIKSNLREKLDGLTTADMEQIRFDIKSVKESLKDIVYVMLSNSDDVKEMVQVETERKAQKTILTPLFGEGKAVESKNCGTDGMCFDKAVRICKPVTFMPDGRAGATIAIKGLEGGACILHVEEPEAMGPPGFEGKIYMDCQIKDYASGIMGPEDIMPFCEGPMREMYDKYGSKGQGGGPQAYSGPGGCTSDRECNAFCEKNPDECLKWCRENPDMCPNKAESDLKSTMKGRAECGNGLCEPDFGETLNNCPSDCMRGGCGNGVCEEDYGELPETCPDDCGGRRGAGGRCECTWAAGTREHPTGCTVFCDDYSYDQGACEAYIRDGCRWKSGMAVPVERVEPAMPVERVERKVQACVGCLNNGICDVGECSECIDCIQR